MGAHVFYFELVLDEHSIQRISYKRVLCRLSCHQLNHRIAIGIFIDCFLSHRVVGVPSLFDTANEVGTRRCHDADLTLLGAHHEVQIAFYFASQEVHVVVAKGPLHVVSVE